MVQFRDFFIEMLDEMLLLSLVNQRNSYTQIARVGLGAQSAILQVASNNLLLMCALNLLATSARVSSSALKMF